ncbi:MAG: HNH endonuclease [Magnetospirillum sp.]|nr:HNH endonuclease [Magnetospirillum sp.]
MNSRGLDLSPTDILKAEIIGELPDPEKPRYTDVWEEIEADLGRESFLELFAHIRMIFVKAKARQSLTQDFRAGITNAIEPRAFIDTVLTPLSGAYEVVSNAAYEAATLADQVNAYLRYLNRLDNTDWVPPAISFVSRHGKDPVRLLALIRDLERLAYAMFIVRANVNERISRYADVLRAIEKGDDLTAEASPLQLSAAQKAQVLDALDGPIYPLLRVRMPLLLRLDSLLADGGAIYDHRIISIEHVLPQTPPDGSTWLEWFPEGEMREHWVHRLANLLLLSHQKNSPLRRRKWKWGASGVTGSPTCS